MTMWKVRAFVFMLLFLMAAPVGAQNKLLEAAKKTARLTKGTICVTFKPIAWTLNKWAEAEIDRATFAGGYAAGEEYPGQIQDLEERVDDLEFQLSQQRNGSL